MNIKTIRSAQISKHLTDKPNEELNKSLGTLEAGKTLSINQRSLLEQMGYDVDAIIKDAKDKAKKVETSAEIRSAKIAQYL